MYNRLKLIVHSLGRLTSGYPRPGKGSPSQLPDARPGDNRLLIFRLSLPWQEITEEPFDEEIKINLMVRAGGDAVRWWLEAWLSGSEYCHGG